MKAVINVNSRTYAIFIDQPLDISIPLRAEKQNVNAWYQEEPKIEPVKIDDWVGSIAEGADVNFYNIFFNPHAHGTHTECVGHITEEKISVNQCLKQFFFVAEVITVVPEKFGADFVISAKQLRYAIGNKKREAIIIRTYLIQKKNMCLAMSKLGQPLLQNDMNRRLKQIGLLNIK